jgi:hypothetical protein
LKALLLVVSLSAPAFSQQPASLQPSALPDAPSALLVAEATPYAFSPAVNAAVGNSAIAAFPVPDTSDSFVDEDLPADLQQNNATPSDPQKPAHKRSSLLGDAVDENGNPIPLERQQPKRILGFMPNYRTVAAGAAIHKPGWKYNFKIATRQSFDYSSFVFLGLTTISAEGLNEHPVLGKGVHGFYSYGWRGLIDKTDGTYLGAWLLPSLLHEDTRYYPLGSGHSILIRSLYVISRQGVARTYSGRNTPNIAGLGGKVLTQVISREYYPTGATSFGVLAEKFGYAAMRDVAFSSVREFYPDIAAHYIHKHDRKVAAMAARDAQSSGVTH